MPPDRSGKKKKPAPIRVWCLQCKKMTTQKHERTCRHSSFVPLPVSSSIIPFLGDAVVDSGSESEYSSDSSSQQSHLELEHSPMDINSGMSDFRFENQDLPASSGDGFEFSFEALGIHDQWAYVKQLYGAAWEVTPDLEEHEENTEFPMEDGRAADQDSEGEEDEYGDIGHIDWEQFRGYGRGGRLTAAEEAQAEFIREFTNIKEMLGKYDLAICRAFAYKVQTHVERGYAVHTSLIQSCVILVYA
ncbi:hypothetical protein EV359DRAFT_88049 [Lentinula novae-zelandiae]|nr:hypothetical protein EV359DRAFT_88049 [Lentinula novae-zelandiae]